MASSEIKDGAASPAVRNSDAALLAVLTRQLGIALAVITPDLTYVYANDSYSRVLGLSESNVIGLKVPDVLGAETYERVRPQLERALTGERVSYETERPTNRGNRHFSLTYEPTVIDGRTVSVTAVVYDITDTVVARTDLKRFAAIVDSSDDAIISKDLNGIIMSWNPAAERIFGYTAEEMIGSSILRLIPEERRDEETRILESLRRNERVDHLDTIRRTKSGALINISVTASPIRDEDGNVIGASKIARDITAERRAQEELSFQRTMLLTERELTPDGIIAVDNTSTILSYNQRFASMFGIPPGLFGGLADGALRAAILRLMKDPSAYVARMQELYDNPDMRTQDEVDLLDGRTLDRYSAPMKNPEGRFYGRVWYFTDVTARKRTEIMLRHERDRAQLYLDTAGVFIISLDLAGRISLVNRYACSFLGWLPNELIGRDFIDTCVPEPLRFSARERLWNSHTGGDAPLEEFVVTRAGSEHLVEWRTTFLRDPYGAIIGTLSSGTDITERRQAEMAIRAERDRAQRYLDTANVMLLALDENGRITSINRKGCEMLHSSEDRLIGLNWIETFLPPRIRALSSQKFDNLLHGDTSAVENPIITATGEELLIEWRNSVLRDDTGNVIGTFSSGADITERNRAIQSLRQTEERMRFALQNAGVGVWDFDYTSNEFRVTDVLEGHFGLAPGAFEGTMDAFIRRIHPDDRQLVMEAVEEALTNGEFHLKYRVVWDDGTVRWLTGVGRVHLGKEGEPVRAVGVATDITERQSLEAQYHQSQKMEAVGRLAGGIAHDFNNLLTAILGYCEMLQFELDASDPRTADIREIQKAGESAAGLTRQLLAFSRKQIIQPVLLDLTEVAANANRMIERLIGEDIKIVMKLRPDIAPIRADRGQIEQITLNLAVNARDAMPDGGRLTIETANVDLDEDYAISHLNVKPGRYVALTITDTGTGMTPEVQARLFEPFFTTKEVGKGTGLGLATVHGIVLASGGSVGVYSELGRGTSFKVYFPAAQAAADDQMPAKANNKPAAGTGSATVLVVEDGEALRQLIRRMLEPAGYTVIAASNAAEAKQCFADHDSIDLLLTDVVMPDGSGPSLARTLLEVRPDLRVIYMSGYTEDAITQHDILLPSVSFINKPFAARDLIAKINEVLENRAL